jgi:hypothetical protein
MTYQPNPNWEYYTFDALSKLCLAWAWDPYKKKAYFIYKNGEEHATIWDLHYYLHENHKEGWRQIWNIDPDLLMDEGL